jgi:tRNA(Ile)-lysidine synthetase-like protein
MTKQEKSSRTLAAPQISQELLRPGERVGVAVSGGADSVALLLLLLELREKIGFVPCVVHFNHKLRGKASDADEKFVADLAKKHDLEFFSAHDDVAAKSKRERINLEDAARRARYSFFEELVNDGRVHRVAVAHTADDQAETVLAHILRGTGLAGLAGIHPEAGPVFRPLLGTRRAALRVYLRSRRQPWREDATNRDMARNRARIRLKLMPLLERQFQPAVVEHLCQLAEFSREDEAYLDGQAVAFAKSFMQVGQQEVRIPLTELLAHPRAMQTRVIRRVVGIIKGLHIADMGHSSGVAVQRGDDEHDRKPKNREIPHSADSVRNDEERGLHLADMGRSSAAPLQRGVDGSPGGEVGGEHDRKPKRRGIHRAEGARWGRQPHSVRNDGGQELADMGHSSAVPLQREQRGARAGQLSATHVKAVLQLAEERDSGKQLQLPAGVEVRRDRDALRFRPIEKVHLSKQAGRSTSQEYSYSVDLRSGDVEVSILELSRVVRFRVIDWPAEGRETSVTGAFLDRNKLRLPLVVRNWKPGDALRPLGHQKRHKLARLLNELGISRWEKASWPVLSDGEQVLWARGLPVAAEFAASSATRAGVLIIEDREA